jgi:hypothetical protein
MGFFFKKEGKMKNENEEKLSAKLPAPLNPGCDNVIGI